MKTIMFVECGRSGYGGSFHSLYQTVISLDRKKYRIVVVYFNNTGFYEKMVGIGIECYYIKDVIYSEGSALMKYLLGKVNGFTLRFLPQLSIWIDYLIHFFTIRVINSLVREKKIELLHLNNQLVYNFFGVFVARSSNIPCVSHLRTFNSYGINKNKIVYTKKINIHYIAISEQIKKHWVEKGLNSKKIDVIYNVYQSSDEDALPDNDIPSISEYDGCKIIFVGRLIDCKGIPFLLKSFEQIINNNINAKLFLVGDGEEENKLKEYISELNIKQHVVFLGYRSNPQAFIRKADLLVLPSSKEGFGRVLLEAMDVGTPVIGTRIGGMPEIIEHGVNGLLVNYGDVDNLKRSIITILKDESLRSKIIQGGYESINSKFCVETYQGKLENVYDTLLDVAS